jgi:hypothetical protein
MEEPAFDIFAGALRRHARWVEAVHGVSNARERMYQIAEESPGCYFLYCSREGAILIKIETFEKLGNKKYCYPLTVTDHASFSVKLWNPREKPCLLRPLSACSRTRSAPFDSFR